MNVDLLQPSEALGGGELFEAFPRAAAEAMRVLGRDDDACITWNRDCASISSHVMLLHGGIDGFDAWIEIDAKNFKGTLKEVPDSKELQLPIEEQLIVEFYSR